MARKLLVVSHPVKEYSTQSLRYCLSSFHSFQGSFTLPILLFLLNYFQLFPSISGWPFPHYYGACGRIVAVGDAGVKLRSALHWPWGQRVHVAISLMRAVSKLTENSERYIIHLLDLSFDNFAIDTDGTVTVVDAENVLVTDLDSVFGKALLNVHGQMCCHF